MRVWTCRVILGRREKLLEKSRICSSHPMLLEKEEAVSLCCDMVKLIREINPKAWSKECSVGWVTAPSPHQLPWM